MIAKNQPDAKDWLDFESASTYEYAQGEMRAVKEALTK